MIMIFISYLNIIYIKFYSIPLSDKYIFMIKDKKSLKITIVLNDYINQELQNQVITQEYFFLIYYVNLNYIHSVIQNYQRIQSNRTRRISSTKIISISHPVDQSSNPRQSVEQFFSRFHRRKISIPSFSDHLSHITLKIQ